MLSDTFPPVPINSRKMKKETAARGIAKVSKGITETWLNNRGFQGVNTFIMLCFIIAYFYIAFEYYVNCTGRRIAAKMRSSGLKLSV